MERDNALFEILIKILYNRSEGGEIKILFLFPERTRLHSRSEYNKV